jgi:hypothetical protein
MATTTPNYGWTVPTSTDLVKDGATAIETLGDAIDASMNTALGTKKAGMVLLNTTSFSGVSSQSINDVFSATYTNYRILVNVSSASATATLGFRFRVSGADDSNNVYRFGGWYASMESGVSGFDSNATGTSFLASSHISGAYPTYSQLEIAQPFSAAPTPIQLTTTYNNGVYTGSQRLGTHTNSTSFTGFSLIASSGNVTGRVLTYGYNQ